MDKKIKIQKKIDTKLTKLTEGQTITWQRHDPFYPRVINNINITFSEK
jgi:hypothetical protein